MSTAATTGVPEVVVRAAVRAGVDLKALRAYAARVLVAVGAGERGLGIKLTSDAVIRRLNRKYRGVDRPTDVLSFSAGDGVDLGDLVISLATARRQARLSGLSFEREIHELVLHGILHLQGHDHASDHGEMNRLELKLRRRLLDAPHAEV